MSTPALRAATINMTHPLAGGIGCNAVETSTEATGTLPAGEHSIVPGSNVAATDTDRQGYRANLTAVPNPGAAFLVFARSGIFGFSPRRTA